MPFPVALTQASPDNSVLSDAVIFQLQTHLKRLSVTRIFFSLVQRTQNVLNRPTATHHSSSLMTRPETINWFEHCVLVHEGQIRSFLRHYFAEGSDIEDCIQETYARLLEMTPDARTSVRQWRAFRSEER